jgi:CHAD domain-containing protein
LTPAETRSASLRNRLSAFEHELEGLDQGRASAVHRVRVAARRLRELVPLLGLRSDVTDKVVRRLRKTTKRLGIVREADALTLLVEELRARRIHSAQAVDVLADAVANERMMANQQVRGRLTTARLRRLTSDLEDILEQLEEEDDASPTRRPARAWLWALDARLVHCSGQLRAAVEATGPMYRPDQLDDVRIAVEKLRCGTELAMEAGIGSTAPDLATLTATEDGLGRLHDLEVLIERARGVQALHAPPDLATWRALGSIVHDLEEECRQLHAGYMSNRSRLLKVCDRAAGRRLPVAASRRAAG